jgi:hypothetical protein
MAVRRAELAQYPCTAKAKGIPPSLTFAGTSRKGGWPTQNEKPNRQRSQAAQAC